MFLVGGRLGPLPTPKFPIDSGFFRALGVGATVDEAPGMGRISPVPTAVGLVVGGNVFSRTGGRFVPPPNPNPPGRTKMTRVGSSVGAIVVGSSVEASVVGLGGRIVGGKGVGKVEGERSTDTVGRSC